MNIEPRPQGLPDFTNPPLGEVVIGAQFNPPLGYSQILAGEVWALFRDQYPLVQEMRALPPQFETFGLPSGPQFGFNMVTGGQHDRFWFLTKDHQELIQFQQDRLLHNWRKIAGGTREYPHFESIIARFEEELDSLEKYFGGLAEQRLTFTQAEISYINHIYPTKDGEGSRCIDWITALNFGDTEPDDITFVSRRALYRNDAPFARLTVDLKTALDERQRELLLLTLTVRGFPPGQTIAEVVDFIKYGRRQIVEEFLTLTTDFAHRAWNRTA